MVKLPAHESQVLLLHRTMFSLWSSFSHENFNQLITVVFSAFLVLQRFLVHRHALGSSMSIPSVFCFVPGLSLHLCLSLLSMVVLFSISPVFVSCLFPCIRLSLSVFGVEYAALALVSSLLTCRLPDAAASMFSTLFSVGGHSSGRPALERTVPLRHWAGERLCCVNEN